MVVLADLIREAVGRYNDDVLFVDRGLYRRKEFSYKKIFLQASAICGFFEKRRIKKRDKIIIYLPNSSDYATILCACALSGVIAVPIDFNSNLDFASRICKIVKARLMFCSVFKEPSNGKKFYLEEMNNIYEEFNQHKPKTKINEEDIFEIVYTSGTTAEPKGVVIKNKNIGANLESMRKIIDFDIENYVFLSILPLSHLFEQTIGFFLPMVYGAAIVYISSRKSSAIIEAIKKENVSAIVSVPLFLSSIKNKIEFTAKESGKYDSLKKALKRFENSPKFLKKIVFASVRKNLGKLNFLITGGAALDIEVEKFWKTLGYNVLQGYGLTETSPVLTYNSITSNKIGTVGKPLHDVEVKIVNGEIVARGKNVFSGYYQNRLETAKVLKNGWLYTGDIGEFDEQGFLRITGRKKNMILSPSGLNVYPEDIEKVLNKLEGVKDSVVLGLDNGKTLAGVIITSKKIDIDELLKKTNSQLSPHQYLSKIYIWHEADFPRTPTKKIIRRKVEEGLKIGKKEKVTSDDKLAQIISEVCDINARKVREKSLLVNLGLDSLKRIELTIKIEEAYNLDFNEDDITDKTTVADLRKLIAACKEFKSESGLSILNHRFFNPLRVILQRFFFLASGVIYSLKVKGIENLPKDNEQVIFIANHCSQFDTLTILKALPRKVRMNSYAAAAKDYFFTGIGRLLGFFGAIVFNAFAFSRDTNIKQSLKDFGEVINRKGNVLIYPEGTRSTTGKLLPFKPGIGLLTWNMEVPVIPIKSKGLYEILPKGRIIPKNLPRSGKVEIIIGKPLKFSKMQSFQEITDILREELENL